MKISDLLRLSFDNLKRRKGRTILTVLGVVIGTCSIVLMMSIGVALNVQQQQYLEQMGDLSRIEVNNWGSSSEVSEIEPLTDEMVEYFNSIEGVKIATPFYHANLSIAAVAGINGKYELGHINIIGIYQEAMPDLGYELKDGDFPQGKAPRNTFTAVVGEYFPYEFMDSKKRYPNNRIDPYSVMPGEELPEPFFNVLTEDIGIISYTYENGTQSTLSGFNYSLQVTGILESENQNYEAYYGVIMPLDQLLALEEAYQKASGTIDRDKNKEREYDQVIVIADDVDAVESVIEEIELMGYSTWSAASYREAMQEQTMMIQLILGGLGSISLFVAAIGIANTMTMAIYERTKEIGVMKVLGCDISDIRNMFLIEAAGIGFLGGVVGIVFSYGISTALNAFGSQMSYDMTTEIAISVIPLWLVLLGMGFAVGVGVLSGLLPALRAVKITALSAIRHE